MKTRTCILLTILMGASAGNLVTASIFRSGLTPEQLQCEHRTDPLGLDVTQPHLNWIVTSSQRGKSQSAYRILVASSRDLLDKETGDLWDSGIVESDQTTEVPYDGKPLQSNMPCFWKVRVWDEDDNASGWSKPACWSMGLLGGETWQAKWIAFDGARPRPDATQGIDLSKASWIWYPEGNPASSAPVAHRLFRKEFTIPADRKIASAMLAMSVDNWFKLYLNGRPVADGSNHKEAMVADLAERLQTGKNVIAVDAANQGDNANPAGLLAFLKIKFADGEVMVITSDDTWTTAQSAPVGWQEVDYDATGWKPTKVVAPYGAGPWGEVSLTQGKLFLPPAQYLRKRFVVEQPIKRATLYASALGNYYPYLNGRQVGDAYFAPGWTDYKVRVYYNTYDVTDQIEEGFNVLGAVLGDGWYSGFIGWGRLRDHYGTDPRFSAELLLEFADGTSKVIMTDDSWKAATGPILEGDFLMGETYDARAELADWSEATTDDATWPRVDVAETIGIKIEPHPGVPVREFQEIKPIGRTEPAGGTYVFNMGTNFAGVARLKVRDAQPGQKIVLRFAERLNPDGTIYVTNLRGARATDTYICKGEGTEIWRPHFTFHGFQYVEVTGYPGEPDMDAISGIELTSATPVVGHFECSDVVSNKLYHNICQTQRANFIEVPTDCPQRDERLGWMGDAQIYVRTATYNTDVAAFFTKWLVDVDDAQLKNGAFSDVSPRIVAMAGGVAAWGDAGVICPWTIYQVYGDKRILADHYDAMEKWIAYCKGTTNGTLLRPAHGYGDWLSIQANTPKEVLATAYFAYSTKLVAKTAEVLGKTQDAKKYNQLFADIKKAFNDAYVGDDGRIKGNTQTDYVLALAFDLLDEADQKRAIKYLVDDIQQRDWHLSTGFVGTKDLMTTLTRCGRTDVAYVLFHNDTFPSWGFSIAHGATSIWERWDGWTPEKGFQDPGMNSFAHYSFGAVGEWMFKTLGGIDTDGPAYKHIIIRPRPNGKLAWAKTSYDSIRGEIATAWEIDIKEDDGQRQEHLRLDVTIPANTTATVYVPTTNPASIREGGRSAVAVDTVQFVGTEDDCAVFKIGSGKYRFTTPLP